jgi:hypothetical protein
MGVPAAWGVLEGALQPSVGGGGLAGLQSRPGRAVDRGGRPARQGAAELVSEDYSRLRAMALLRADEAPEYRAAPGRSELPYAERDRLRDEFLSASGGIDFV